MTAARLIPAALGGLLLALLSAGPAAAHGQDASTAGDYRVSVTAVEPAVAGVRVRAVEGGARLELTNAGLSTVDILGLQGEPFLRVSANGVVENRAAPSLYTSRSRTGTARLPAGVDAFGRPDWHPAGRQSVVRWHDLRAAGRTPARNWSVPLFVDGRVPAVIRGTVQPVPPPKTAYWWAASLAAAGLIAALGLPRRRLPIAVAVVGLLSGGLAVVLTVALAHAASVPGSATDLFGQLGARIWALLSALALAVAAVLARRWPRTDPALCITAGFVTFEVGTANGAVLGHSVLAGPAWIRPATAAVLATALGLTIAAAIRWHRASQVSSATGLVVGSEPT